MPAYSGLGVLAALRGLPTTTRVIMMTGERDATLRRRARELGALGVFQKPFDMDDLRTTLFYLGREGGAAVGARPRDQGKVSDTGGD